MPYLLVAVLATLLKDAVAVTFSWPVKHRSLTMMTAGGALVAVAAVLVMGAPGHRASQIRLGDAGVWVTNDVDRAVGRFNSEVGELNSAIRSSALAPEAAHGTEAGQDATAEVEPSVTTDVAQDGTDVVVVTRTAESRSSTPRPAEHPDDGLDDTPDDRDVGIGTSPDPNAAPPSDAAGYATASVLDPSTVRFASTVLLPSASTEVHLVGGNETVPTTVVLLDPRGGRLWQIPFDQLKTFDASQNPDAVLGDGAVVAAAGDGRFYAAAPSTGEVLRFDAGASLSSPLRARVDIDANAVVQLAADGETWALLDEKARQVLSAEGAVDVRPMAPVTSTSGAQGQSQTAAFALQRGLSSAAVLLATSSGLHEVGLVDGEVRTITDVPHGIPAHPVTVNGCSYAAWSDGTVWQRCAGGAHKGFHRLESESESEADLTTERLKGMSSGASLTFRTNRDGVVLNDTATGALWSVTNGSALVSNWSDVLTPLGGVSRVAPLAVAEPLLPVTREPREKPDPREEAHPVVRTPAQPPIEGVVAPADDVLPSSGPPSQPERGESPPSAGTPLSTTVTAHLDESTGVATLTWPAFDGNGSAMRGYFAQALGAASAPVGESCAIGSTSRSVTAPTGGEVIDVGLDTTATFDGVTEPGVGHGFVVWGYNAVGCTASRAVVVTPTPSPGPVVAVTGTMRMQGTEYDYRIDAVSPAASHYEVQRLDASGTPTGDVALFSGSAAPRELTAGPFGEKLAYQLRACNQWGDYASCGPWSAQSAPEPSLTFAFEGLVYSAERGEWTWLDAPLNGHLMPTIVCVDLDHFEVPSTIVGSSCQMESPIDSEAAALLVFIGTKAYQYVP
ncbi:hypothetical protein GCM10027416_16720 [Okibacterium endophyticum]